MQERIKYHEIMSLGFKEEFCHDDVYFREYGFQYVITTLKLTKYIYLDWDKATQFVKMVRLNKDLVHIEKEMLIKDLTHLQDMIYFFSDKKVSQDYNPYAAAC